MLQFKNITFVFANFAPDKMTIKNYLNNIINNFLT